MTGTLRVDGTVVRFILFIININYPLRGKKRAVARVHGGGFAGTVQAFVPTENVPAFRTAMDAVFGDGATSPLRVRAEGAIRVL